MAARDAPPADGPPLDGPCADEPPTDGRRRRGRTIVSVLIPVLLLVAAGGLRASGLAEPPRAHFDEVYYVDQARDLRIQGAAEGFVVHPPLGTWLIAGSMTVFGDGPFGWRAGPAAAGTLTVVGVYLAGLRLFRRRGAAALAAVLLAVDGLAFTMSRIAMLDAFLALFVVAGFWLLLVDRDHLWAGARRRPCRWLAGVAFGLALATKWSGLLALGAAGVVLLGGELRWRQRVLGSPWAGWWRAAGAAALALVAVPALVYLASHTGWFVHEARSHDASRADADAGSDGEKASPASRAVRVAGSWWQEQWRIGSYHATLTADHPYRSHAATWPVLARPVAFSFESCAPEDGGVEDCRVEPGHVAHHLGVGNPVLWWLALPAYPALLWLAVRRRDGRAWALLAFLAVQYLPWLAVDRPLFLYYMTPVVPFMALGLLLVADHLAPSRVGRWAPTAIAALAVASFLFLHPVLAGSELSREAWRSRMLLDSWV